MCVFVRWGAFALADIFMFYAKFTVTVWVNTFAAAAASVSKYLNVKSDVLVIQGKVQSPNLKFQALSSHHLDDRGMRDCKLIHVTVLGFHRRSDESGTNSETTTEDKHNVTLQSNFEPKHHSLSPTVASWLGAVIMLANR